MNRCFPARLRAFLLALLLSAFLGPGGGAGLRGQSAPGGDLPADPSALPAPAPAETPAFLDGAPPAPNPTPAPPSSLLIDPGATPAPLPTPDPRAQPRLDNRVSPAPGTGAEGPPPADAAAGTGAGGGAGATAGSLGEYRRFRYHFLLSLNAIYTDNLFLSSSHRQGDLFFTIDPTLTLGYGDLEGGSTNSVSFSYTPEALLYVNNPQDDAVQHFINFRGVYRLSQITLTGSQSISLLNSTDFSQQGATALGTVSAAGTTVNPGLTNPGNIGQPTNNVNLDASRRSRLNVYATGLGAGYAYSDKTSFSLSAGFSANDYSTLISSQIYSLGLDANYALSSKISVGLGVTGGYVAQAGPNPSEEYEQGNLRLGYHPSDKFSFGGTLGLELRQRSDSSRTAVNPVFSLSATYLPFDSTALSLSASRQTSTSAVNGAQDINSTSFTFSASQRFFQRVFVRLSLGYTNSAYTSSNNAIDANRTDNYFFLQPAVDYNLRDNVSVGAFYLFRRDDSNQNQNTAGGAVSGFTNNEVGAHISFSF